MILYMSTILGIDPSLYEAATLDGATRWQQHKKITIPLMIPTIVMLFILSLGQIFRSDFGLFYQVPMNQGALYPVTQTIDTYVYRALLKTNDVGMSSAASFVQSVVGFIFIVGANKVVSRLDENSKLF
jgi:putative aldouronate transport system permease protein